MNIIGNNLIALREALNLTQAEVAEGIDMSRDYLSRIETGARSSAGQNIIRLLATKLSSTEEWLTKSTGWAYDPPTTYKAIEFVERQINKFKTNKIIIINYSFEISPTADDYIKANGLVFFRSNGPISMAGSQTLSGYHGRGTITYMDTLEMIKNANIKTGRIRLNKTESRYLINANILEISQQAKFDENLVEREINAVQSHINPMPSKAKETKPSKLILSNDEILLLEEKMRESKVDVNDLIRYMNEKLINKR